MLGSVFKATRTRDVAARPQRRMASRRRAWGVAAGAAALIASLTSVAPAASAGTSTKYYSASASPLIASVSTASDVTVTLTNDPSSRQSFGSAELTFGASSNGITAGDVPVVSVPGWSWSFVSQTAPAVLLLTSGGTGYDIAPGASLSVEVQLTAPSAGSVTIATAVKQSNDFSGTNNDFSNTGSDPVLTVVQPQYQQRCSGSCDTGALTSSTTGTTADLGASSSGTTTSGNTFDLTASFGSGLVLSCDSLVSGNATADPFLYFSSNQTPSTTISGTLTLTFPRSIVNAVPDNGAPHMPVCAGATEVFPTTRQTPGDAAYPYQGLLYDCTDPGYVVGANEIGLCVESRRKLAGGAEQVVVYTSSLTDPMSY